MMAVKRCFIMVIILSGILVSSCIDAPNPTNYCTITFVTNGGNSIDSITVPPKTTYYAINDYLPVPTRNLYVFDGWYTDASLTNSVRYEYDTITKNVSIYAKWTSVFSYTLNNNTITITGFNNTCPDSIKTNLSIPSYLNGYPVTKVSGFYGESKIKTVSFPKTVTEVSGFDQCINITSVTLPSSIKIIGDYFLSNCDLLTSITFGDNLKSIGSRAFQDCAGLTSISFPKSLEAIGSYAFYSCISLQSVDFGKAQATLGSEVFSYCQSLTEINNFATKSISYDVFSSCPLLCSISIADTVSEITSSLQNIFGSNITSVTLPASVTSINKYAFYYLPSNCVFTVKNGSYAYQWCAAQGKIVQVR